MDDALRLLLIEQSSNDAEAITNMLRNAGHAVRAKRIDHEDTFKEALDEQDWDLIISAPAIQHFDALQALQILRSNARDIPFVVVLSGQSQLTISDAMHAGARDVVQSDDPDHLQCVIERELGDLKLRRNYAQCRKAMLESERRCRSLMGSSRDAITYVHEGMHVHANQVYLEMFGYTDRDEIESMPIMDMVHVDDHPKFKQFLRKFSGRDEDIQGEIEVRCVRADESEFNAIMEFSPATIEGEACTQIIIRSQSDKELEKKLNRLSKQDLLTGLYNRQYFLDMLKVTVSDAKSSQRGAGLLFIDMDSFNEVKDAVGISASQVVLGDIAKLLGELVSEPDIIARFSDQTFTVLARSDAKDKIAEQAERLRHAIEEHISEVSGQAITLTCSIGISLIDQHTANAQDALSRADIACGIARSSGGNTIHFHNPIADEQAGKERTAEWLSRLRDALDNNRFYLTFQPIVSLHGDTAENYEVLLRLRDPEGQEILPGQFMSAAEQGGMLGAIDRWVTERAIQRLASERAQGKQTQFFIKLSADTIRDPEFLHWLSSTVKSQRLSSEALVFEISDTAAINNLTPVKNLINGLQQLHCRVVLDHFGTSPNSMKVLKHLEIDFLKIDGTLIHGLADSPENQQAVKEIAQTANSLGKRTIAEFVQDANSLAILWQCGVNYIQGYFLQEPSEVLEYDFSAEE